MQIAWSGVLPPDHVPIFPTLRQERFMAYQAIIAGARGLVFFGGDITKAMNPEDAASGWNWTFWHTVLKPVVQELSSDSVGPAARRAARPDSPSRRTPPTSKLSRTPGRRASST